MKMGCFGCTLAMRVFWTTKAISAVCLYSSVLFPSAQLTLHVVVGRIKDIIIRGGENLFPVQIENVLTAHPAVLEAAAVSVPDTQYGEVVGAWIVPAPGSNPTRAE